MNVVSLLKEEYSKGRPVLTPGHMGVLSAVTTIPLPTDLPRLSHRNAPPLPLCTSWTPTPPSSSQIRQCGLWVWDRSTNDFADRDSAGFAPSRIEGSTEIMRVSSIFSARKVSCEKMNWSR